MLAHDTPSLPAVSTPDPSSDPPAYRDYPLGTPDFREFTRGCEQFEYHGLRPPMPPAACNTQAETSQGVDYVALTSKSDRTGGVFASLFGVELDKWEELPYGGHLYSRCRQLCTGVRVYYNGLDGMGSYCQISGEGCRGLEARGIIRDWQEFAILCVETYALKCRRLDLFRDDCKGLLDVGELEGKIAGGECTMHAQEYERRGRQARGMRGKRISDTLNIGSRKSESFMRIYDKTLELRPKGRNIDDWRAEHGHHVRVELELKVKRAHKAMQRLALMGFAEGFIAGMIRGFVDFKVSNADGKNGNRVATWGPWLDFLSGEAKVKLGVNYEEPSLDKALYHHEKQYGPTLATRFMALGGDVDAFTEEMRGLAIRGKNRMRKKHYALLAEVAA